MSPVITRHRIFQPHIMLHTVHVQVPEIIVSDHEAVGLTCRLAVGPQPADCLSADVLQADADALLRCRWVCPCLPSATVLCGTDTAPPHATGQACSANGIAGFAPSSHFGTGRR
jgi:hypothetical protein